MIEKENNKNYCVYQHVCPDGKIYIGVTCNIRNRWKPSNYKKNNTPFKDAIDLYGWSNIKHEVVASCLSYEEALKLEGELIINARESGTSLNVNRSGYYTRTDEFKDEKKARAKAWSEANPERHKASKKTWYEAHPEECKARAKAWYEAHPEECKARAKAWNEAHPDYQKTWREANKDKDNTRSKTNKDKDNARSKAFREANPNYMREWREAHPNYMREWRKRKKGGGDKT